ncbi:lysostaphin resistance A-like protein [Roseateles sp. UC29_93]|uniref:CPBP family intramembrane glutamic endopeptidase n=1 Tax=Roseateles sp. UC29_93 TaxID=3350177 RepID=UPI0036717B61
MPDNKSPFPSALQAGLLLLATLVLQQLVGAALYDFRETLGLSLEQMTVLVTVLADGIVIAVAMQMQGVGYREVVHPDLSSLLPTLVLVVPAVLLLTPLLLLLNSVLFTGLQAVLPLSDYEARAFTELHQPSLSMALMVCVVAPVVEEMLFRGVLLRGFLQRYPRGLAIGYSALYFGVAHLNIYQFCLAFLLGLLLGLLYERGRSLMPCIALHAAFNTTGFLLSDPGEGTSDAGSAIAAGASAGSLLWLTALIAAVIGALALHKLLGLWRR